MIKQVLNLSWLPGHDDRSSSELLAWAIENIKQWDEYCPMLRCDGGSDPAYYESGTWVEDEEDWGWLWVTSSEKVAIVDSDKDIPGVSGVLMKHEWEKGKKDYETRGNKLLLEWAVKNIDEWDKNYPDLRCGGKGCIFYSSGPRGVWDKHDKGYWWVPYPIKSRLYRGPSLPARIAEVGVISFYEWKDAKWRYQRGETNF